MSLNDLYTYNETELIDDIGKNKVCISNHKDVNHYDNVYMYVNDNSNITSQIQYNSRSYYNFNNTTNILIEDEYLSE